MLGDHRLDATWDGLPFRNHVRRHLQRVLQHVPQPGGVDGRVWLQAALVVGPFLVGRPQLTGRFRVVGVQPLRKGIHQHRHAQKRAGDL